MKLELITLDVIEALGDVKFLTFTEGESYEYNWYVGGTYYIWDNTCDAWDGEICGEDYYLKHTHYLILED